MRSDFLSKILTKSYLFAVHVYDGKKLFFFNKFTKLQIQSFTLTFLYRILLNQVKDFYCVFGKSNKKSISVFRVYSYVGTWSVLFDISKVKQLNTIKNCIIIKEMRSDFLSKILTKSYLFAVHVYDGKKLFFFNKFTKLQIQSFTLTFLYRILLNQVKDFYCVFGKSNKKSIFLVCN